MCWASFQTRSADPKLGTFALYSSALHTYDCAPLEADANFVEQPKYIDLAGSGAHIRRALLADQYPRLAQVLPALGDGEANLQFGQDDHGRPMVEAQVTFDCALQCQLCLEPQTRQVSIEFATLLASDESQAQRWSDHLQTAKTTVSSALFESGLAVSVVGEDLDVAALVEDEVLLQLPANVCTDEDCARRPQLSYEIASDEGEQNDAESDNPFAILEQPKR